MIMVLSKSNHRTALINDDDIFEGPTDSIISTFMIGEAGSRCVHMYMHDI